jgi:transposase-like protein
MKESYQIASKDETRKIAEFLSQNGQLLLPMVEMISVAKATVDDLIDVMGRASIEAVLTLSARSIAGEKHQGKKGGEIGWYGRQPGTVPLSDRKLQITKPRLRKKGKGKGKGGEVEVPAYEAMLAGIGMGPKLTEILMRGVSTRNYETVITDMADTVGVSKSSVSRQFVAQSGKELERLMERRFEDMTFLAIYLDGIVFGDVHVICAVGVDETGNKHVLGIVEGASENGASVTSLLEALVEKGVDPNRQYLFVIDGGKALRKGIDQVFGTKNPVQRCRNHKVRNVCSKLPDDLKDQVKSVMKAAYKLPWKEGIAKLKQQAKWLENLGHMDAAKSLLEGLDETFTVNRLGLSPSLRRCLSSTNIIDSPHSGLRMRTNRVSRWKDGKMVLRWAAAAFLATEKNFRKIMGYKDLWMLKAALNEEKVDQREKVA